jgi:hypothetical protein
VKKAIILFPMAGIFVDFQAPNNAIDSAARLLVVSKEDSNRVGLLCFLASVYVNYKPDTALILALY